MSNRPYWTPWHPVFALSKILSGVLGLFTAGYWNPGLDLLVARRIALYRMAQEEK